jgi:hypothetical protein
LLLLFSFLNTIFFPAICYPPAYQHSVTANNEHTSSLAEYVIEDYLGLTDPNSDSQEEDVNDIIKTTEDIDLIVYYNTIITSLANSTLSVPYPELDSATVQSFYSCSTPPPEYLL